MERNRFVSSQLGKTFQGTLFIFQTLTLLSTMADDDTDDPVVHEVETDNDIKLQQGYMIVKSRCLFMPYFKTIFLSLFFSLV